MSAAIAVAALVTAVVALAVVILGFPTRSRDAEQPTVEVLVEQLKADLRLHLLTSNALAEARAVVRQGGGTQC